MNLYVIYLLLAFHTISYDGVLCNDANDLIKVIYELRRDIDSIKQDVAKQNVIILHQMREFKSIKRQMEEGGKTTLRKMSEVAANITKHKMEDVAQILQSKLGNITNDVKIVKKILTSVLPGKTNTTAAPSCKWLDLHYNRNYKSGMYWVNESKPQLGYCDMMKGTVVNGKTKESAASSCKWLKEHYHLLPSGMYWIIHNTSKECYCDMVKGIEINGKTKESAASSCKWLKEHYHSLPSGMYWIKHNTSEECYCDMVEGIEINGKTKESAAPSCEWLKEHYPSLPSGMYWIKNNTSMKCYCDMEKGIEMPGETKESPAPSCKWLKVTYKTTKSKLYWISLSVPSQVFCDMDVANDGGGWTMIGHAVAESNPQGEDIEYQKLLSDKITELSKVTGKRFLLSGKGLKELKSYINFTQIRFYCHKPWHGRTLHLYTLKNNLGKAVIDLMTDSSNEKPNSCNSYSTMKDDNSKLGQYCSQWYRRKWNGNDLPAVKMYNFPMFVNGHNHLSLTQGRIECDDYVNKDSPNFSVIGQWAFYVR